METLRQWLSQIDRPRILDVGCGAGNFIHLLLETGVKDASFVGIDVSKGAIAAARGHFADHPNIAFVEDDVLGAPLEEGSFDVVCLSNTLHHLKKPDAVFERMRKLLKPGGALLINEMVSDHLTKAQLSHRKLHHFAAEIDRLQGMYHAPTYPKAAYLARLEWLTGKTPDKVWELAFGIESKPTAEQVEQMAGTVDRLLARLPEGEAKTGLLAKGERIKNHMHRHSFAGATQVAAVIVL
jgi:ubiquinone/menaquinone biosynthesis C-methylase UbiE